MAKSAAEVGEFADLTQFELDLEMMRKLPEEFCRRRQAVLLGRPPKSRYAPLPLGMLDVSDDATASEVQGKVRTQVRRVQLNAYEVDKALSFAFGNGDEEPSPPAAAEPKERLILSHERRVEFDRGQPVAKMVADTLSEAVRSGASDVHVETYGDDVDVRLRIDGVLRQLPTPFSRANIRKVVSYCKVLADLDIAEHHRPQDGRIGTVYVEKNGSQRQIDLRLAVLPGPHGDDMVMRVLDEGRIRMSLTELGMPAAVHESFQRMIRTPGGLVIVAGPTASGKTTTLYAALNEINTAENKILTVEDPIEYSIPKVNQKQAGQQMSFAEYSRAFMRQNPDILMIGEVRDEETAAIALRAAQIGNLVLSTLHTRNALSSVVRLLVLGADRSLVASGLLGVLSQRLVRRTCKSCAEPYQPDPAVLSRLPGIPAGTVFVRGRGCRDCQHTGFKGQTGVFELLAFDDTARSRIFRGDELKPEMLPGFLPMCDDAAAKVRNGATTIEEVLRVVPCA